MHNASIVFLTSDTDCDGTAIAAHRVTVPAHRVGEFVNGDARALADFMMGGELPMYQYARDAFEIVTLRDFLREHGHVFADAQDRAEFCGADHVYVDPWGGGIKRERGHGYAHVWDNLRDCTAPYETTADLDEAHYLAGIDADIEMRELLA